MKLKISNSLATSVVLAATLGTKPLSSEGHDFVNRPIADSVDTEGATPKMDVDTSECDSQSALVCIEIDTDLPQFGVKEAKEFHGLVIAHALGKTTPEAEGRLAELQEARRLASDDLSAEMILADYQRHQLVIEAKGFLSRHVKFSTAAH